MCRCHPDIIKRLASAFRCNRHVLPLFHHTWLAIRRTGSASSHPCPATEPSTMPLLEDLLARPCDLRADCTDHPARRGAGARTPQAAPANDDRAQLGRQCLLAGVGTGRGGDRHTVPEAGRRCAGRFDPPHRKARGGHPAHPSARRSFRWLAAFARSVRRGAGVRHASHRRRRGDDVQAAVQRSVDASASATISRRRSLRRTTS